MKENNEHPIQAGVTSATGIELPTKAAAGTQTLTVLFFSIMVSSAAFWYL